MNISESDGALSTFFAHVFEIDATTKKKWVPRSQHSVNVSFYYDANNFIYKILSVDENTVIIDSTLTSAMGFKKTSQKFGQWADAKVNTIFGLGFTSESDLLKFSETFKECRKNVCLGTPPSDKMMSPASSPPSSPANSLTHNGSSSLKSIASSAGSGEWRQLTDSSPGYDEISPHILKQEGRKSPARSSQVSSASSDNQFKFENDRLKKALAQSSSNAKKWEGEFQTLKNNNARLTAALQESAVNVDKWKEQLTAYCEENKRLKKKLLNEGSGSDFSASSGGVASTLALEQKLTELEERIKRKDEEINRLSHHGSGELNLLREKNNELISKMKLIQEENKVFKEKARQAKQNEMKLKQLTVVKDDIDKKLVELNTLHQQMSTLFKT